MTCSLRPHRPHRHRPLRPAASAAAVLVALALSLASCSDSGDDSDGAAVVVDQPGTTATTSPDAPPSDAPSSPETTPPPAPTIGRTVADGLTTPWGLAFLPDGSALVSERDTATIKSIGKGGVARPVGTVPGVDASSEGGLLGIAVRQGRDQTWVYAYLSTTDDNRVVRMPYDGRSLGAPEVIIDGIPVSEIHNGGRVEFGPDGMLYVSTGDASEGGNATDPDSLGGKILRLTPDGRPAPGNPTNGSPVWSSGHRNVQGLAWDDEDRLWASEFGQDTWDELNLIEPGNDYGWPQYEGRSDAQGVTDPEVQWRPDDASPSAVAFADGAVWMAGLAGERLWRIPVAAGRVTQQPRAFFSGELGRLRTVVAAPDGSLWLTTSNTDGRGVPRPDDDRIVQLDLED